MNLDSYATGTGRYLDFTLLEDGRLKVSLNEEGKVEIEELYAQILHDEGHDLKYRKTENSAFWDLIEDWMGSGLWEIVSGEDLRWMYSDDSMLTYQPILDESYSYYGDTPKYLHNDCVWSDPYYAIQSPFEVLRRDGELIYNLCDPFENGHDRELSLTWGLIVYEWQQSDGARDTIENRKALMEELRPLSIDELRARVALIY